MKVSVVRNTTPYRLEKITNAWEELAASLFKVFLSSWTNSWTTLKIEAKLFF